MNTSCKVLPDKIKNVIINEEEIKLKVQETGKLISSEYAGKPLLLLSVLKGAFIFMADLCREITIPCEIEFLKAQSYYEGTESSGEVNIKIDIDKNLSEYNIIIVEDIIDSGRTLSKLYEMIKEKNPLSLKVYTLLDKPERRVVPFEADKSLFIIPDLFVVGFGLDCNEQFRNLPYIAEFGE